MLYGWRKDGCLDPQTLNCAERNAVEEFAAGVSRGEADRIEKAKKK